MADTLEQLIRQSGDEGICGLTAAMLPEIRAEPCMECARAKIKQFSVPRKADRTTGTPFKKGSICPWHGFHYGDPPV